MYDGPFKFLISVLAVFFIFEKVDDFFRGKRHTYMVIEWEKAFFFYKVQYKICTVVFSGKNPSCANPLVRRYL